MPTNPRADSLRKKHHELSKKVEEAQRSPGYDSQKLTEMKKEKLRLKEEIETLSVAAE